MMPSVNVIDPKYVSSCRLKSLGEGCKVWSSSAPNLGKSPKHAPMTAGFSSLNEMGESVCLDIVLTKRFPYSFFMYVTLIKVIHPTTCFLMMLQFSDDALYLSNLHQSEFHPLGGCWRWGVVRTALLRLECM